MMVLIRQDREEEPAREPQSCDDAITVEDAAWIQGTFPGIEMAFSILGNTRIKLEPLHHRFPRRVEAT